MLIVTSSGGSSTGDWNSRRVSAALPLSPALLPATTAIRGDAMTRGNLHEQAKGGTLAVKNRKLMQQVLQTLLFHTKDFEMTTEV